MADQGDQITKEKIAEYKEAFSFFDKNGQGIIETKDLPLLVRSLNMNPTEDELEQIRQEADQGNTGTVEFADFLTAIAQRDVEVDHEEELYNAFRVLNKQSSENKNEMQYNEIKLLLKNGKDPFTEQEEKEMQKLLVPNNEEYFNIEDFTKIIMSSINSNKFA